MKPYGNRNILQHNYEDCHPQKGFVNWWEQELDSISKKKARRKAREEINEQLNELENSDES